MEHNNTKTARATFAGGCFWCVEADFEKAEGVLEVISGYTGGDEADPTYEQVCSGGTGHLEAVQVVYDPDQVSYATLLDIFWRHVDPTDAGGQFVDRGRQYATAIFYHDETQRELAVQSKQALAASGKFDQPIVTPIEPLKVFYPAEGYHQDYYKNNPLRYKLYRRGSGRDQFLKRIWAGGSGNGPSEPAGNSPAVPDSRPLEKAPEALRERLTSLQYRVTQEDATEPPFRNTYWDNHEPGIYVDVVTGEPLFSSTHKFDSGTGWPSFTQPLEPDNVVRKEDRSLFMVRTEVRSKQGDSHLGHLFDDGPAPTGMRYCINSAALRFIPVDQLEQEGYGQYLTLFK